MPIGGVRNNILHTQGIAMYLLNHMQYRQVRCSITYTTWYIAYTAGKLYMSYMQKHVMFTLSASYILYRMFYREAIYDYIAYTIYMLDIISHVL